MKVATAYAEGRVRRQAVDRVQMIDILPEHVRAWIAKLLDEGVTAATIRSNKIILSAIFSTALEDQVTFLHPCKGVRTPPVPKKPLQIITPGTVRPDLSGPAGC